MLEYTFPKIDIKEIEERYAIDGDLNYNDKNPEAYSFHFMVQEIRTLLSHIKGLENQEAIYEKHQEAAGIMLNKADSKIKELEAKQKLWGI